MTGPWRRSSRIVVASFLGLATVTGARTAVAASPPAPWASAVPRGVSIADHIAEAAQRFGLPEHWIRAVMRAESAFDPRATSHAGAMGLMQVMPGTYEDLRARHGLGRDPYAPRDNVLAGAAYLRELYDAFGPSGFLAAYNAGPGRYRDHLATGRPLPPETRLYVAKIASDLGVPSPERLVRATTTGAAVPVVDPLAAPLFVALGRNAADHVSTVASTPSSLFPQRDASGNRQ